MSARSGRDRRAFLRAVGNTAAALPFYRCLEASAAPAPPTEGPALRFVGLYAPHGVVDPYYARRPNETETKYDLRFSHSVLSPFDEPATYGRSFRDQVTVVEGIDLVASLEKKIEAHESASVLLTGSAPRNNLAANESLDQYLAVTRGLGARTRFGSLVLAVGDNQALPGSCLSYATGGAPLPKLIDPAAVFERLFARVFDPDDGTGQALLRQARQRGKSVIDFLRRDLGRLAPRLAMPERVKLDQHLEALRELEKQLDASATGPSALPTCRRPAPPDPTQLTELTSEDPMARDRLVDLQIDLLAMALACDLTRFATLFIAMTEDVHRNVAHAYEGPWGERIAGVPATWKPLADQNRRNYAKGARLLQRLAEWGLLDSTLVLMTSDMGDPARHSVRNVPVVVAGGGGRIKLGRRVVLAPECSPADFECASPRYVSNNKLLVTIAQVFGSPIDSFGATLDPAQASGALSALLP